MQHQPQEDSNIGRLCTMIRWCIEYQIAVISRRYRLFEYKIPAHMIPHIGASLGYIISTHNHFKIGLIKSSTKRKQILTYLKMCMLCWWRNHPITKEEFTNSKLMIKDGSPRSLYKQIGCIDDIKKWWTPEQIDMFRLSDEEITIKGGGIGNWYKARQALWQSRHVIEIYIGVGDKAGTIIVKNIRMKMKVISEKKKVKPGTTSTVMLKRVGEIKGLKNIDNSPYQFSKKMREIAGRCDNIYGERTFNFCSHTTSALLLYNLIIRNEHLDDPTPQISRYFSGLYYFCLIHTP